MFGAKIENMKASGRTTRCTAMARLNGPMAASMKASMSTTKSMESAHFTGQMAENTMELGRMASNMAEVSTICAQVKKK